MSRDAMVGLVCFAGSVALFLSLGHIEEARAAEFPRTIIVIMGILSGLLFLQNMFFRKPVAKRPPFPWARVGGLFVIILIYMYFLEDVGFYLSSSLFFLAVCFIMGWSRINNKQVVRWVVGSVAFTAILYLLFKVILEVQTPTGLLL